MLQNFSDFCTELRRAGFSMGGGNPKGIHAVVPFTWEEAPADTPVRWHTGNPETDPWEWRMRVLEETGDIAYAKLFFGTSGYITAPWYPLFYSVRRRGMDFEDAYQDGLLSRMAARLYPLIRNGELPMHTLRALADISPQEKSEYDRALLELQMGMFITLSGRAQKVNAKGEAYGWSSTIVQTTEAFWAARGITLTTIPEKEAFDRIRQQILTLNPEAKEARIRKFILG